ncbi:MAG: hypothetical protein WB788_04005 [Thermoplasmata archaeon]
MSPSAASTPARISEREVVATAAAFLAEKGYRVYPNPDSGDYFDLVARRGEEVGLVEAKVSNSRAVLVQALKRRAWGDWVAVVLPSERAAERLAARTEGTRAAPVGVWATRKGGVRVVREAAPWVRPGEADPFAELRRRFRAVLDRIDSGEIPPEVRWDGVVRAVRRAGGGRGFAEWRLDEPMDSDR